MPKVAEFAGIAVYIYADDHNPPHFHARHAGDWVLVSIDTVTVLRGGIAPAQLKRLLAWASENKLMLRAKWDSLQ